ncbi:ribonucleotide-diphosphate reductase subunit beta, partial [Rhizobiaceae sp. 2RAB30]
MLDWSEPKSSAQPFPTALPAGVDAHAQAAGLGAIDRGGARVSVDDKRMINARADVNQLLPLKYR